MKKSKTPKFLAAQALHQILPRLERMMRQSEQQAGATGQQLSAIAGVSEFGKDRLHTLARHDGVSRPTMSRIVNTLVDRGWLKKSLDEHDQRAPQLSATQEGRRVLVQCCEERTRLLMTLMDGLTKTECSALASCLRSLNVDARIETDHDTDARTTDGR